MSSEHHVITAWRLRDGVVLYLGEDRRWVEDLEDAARLAGAELEEALRFAKDPKTELEIVDAYPFPVAADGPSGRKVRERIRGRGPTVRPDLCRASPEQSGVIPPPGHAEAQRPMQGTRASTQEGEF